MLKVFYISAILYAVQSISFGLNAAELPRHDAPFGLRFGMSREEVQLPLSPTPDIPDYMKSPDYAPEFIPHYLRVWSPYHSQKALLEECENSFDELNFDYFNSNDWYHWIASRTTEAESGIFRPFSILDSQQARWYGEFVTKEGASSNYLRPEDLRSFSIHTVKVEDKLSDICLIFTEDGLTSVVIQQSSLDSIIEDIHKRLSSNSKYDQYSSRKYYEENNFRFLKNAPRTIYKYFFESRVWLDQSKKIIVAAKYIKKIEDGEAIVNTSALNLFYFSSKLEPIPYISYTDILRRGRTFSRYKDQVNSNLIDKLNKFIQEKEETQKIMKQLEQKEQEFKKVERERLIESFK